MESWGPFLYGEESWTKMKEDGDKRRQWSRATFVLSSLVTQLTLICFGFFVVVLTIVLTAKLVIVAAS